MGCISFDDGDSLPPTSPDVFQPHCGSLVLGAPRVPHRVDIHTEGVTEAALHIVRRQIDEEYRQLAVSSSSSDSVLCRGSVSCSASAERAYRHYRTRRWAMDERRLQHGDD
jgi:hypothetical protein